MSLPSAARGVLRPTARRACALALLLALRAGSAQAAGPAEGERADREPERPARSVVETPEALSVVSGEEMRRGRPAAGLDEALDLVPGVFAPSSENFAQDVRLSIRGFGARAPFGVRGVRVLVDGIPATLPDGQTEVDSIDLAFVDRIEIVRGPISSLHGGGGGGVLSLHTLAPTPALEWRVRGVGGSHDLGRAETLVRGTRGATGYVLGVAQGQTGGYRDHSSGRQTVYLGRLERELPGLQVGLHLSGVEAPKALDPGGLTESEAEQDPRQTTRFAHRFDTGERLDQQQLALTLRRPLAEGRDLRWAVYGLRRDFENRLPVPPTSRTALGQVAFDRTVLGSSLVYTDWWRSVHLLLGLDAAQQSDLRRRYFNENGRRGALGQEQSETVRSVGAFGQGELELRPGLSLVAGLRADWTEFLVGDRFPSDGDQSDRIRFRELSPRLGLRVGSSPRLAAYGNLSTAFQVPTTTELAPADGSGGYDSGIEPERAVGGELGVKGILGDRLAYDVALFELRIRNALVPFESGGRTFFHNAARVRRRGLEVALAARLHTGVTLRAGYTLGDYRYLDTGEREPNLPRHLLGAELRVERPSGLFGVVALRHFSDLPADDANLNFSEGATVSDVRLGWDGPRGLASLCPFVGIRNWTGDRYTGSVRPNAAGGRFLEPAAGRVYYAGLEIRMGAPSRVER